MIRCPMLGAICGSAMCGFPDSVAMCSAAHSFAVSLASDVRHFLLHHTDRSPLRILSPRENHFGLVGICSYIVDHFGINSMHNLWKNFALLCVRTWREADGPLPRLSVVRLLAALICRNDMCHQHFQRASEPLVAVVADLVVAPFKVRVLRVVGGAVYRQAPLGCCEGCLQTNHQRLQALEKNCNGK